MTRHTARLEDLALADRIPCYLQTCGTTNLQREKARTECLILREGERIVGICYRGKDQYACFLHYDIITPETTPLCPPPTFLQRLNAFYNRLINGRK